MALLMCGFCPEYFRAVGAYVPISDLGKWIEQNKDYREHVLSCCGDELKGRSPINYIDIIAKANLKIFHGKFDPVVPVSQSVDFFNTLAKKYPESRAFLDIFDGGHEIDMEAAMYWIISQYKTGQKTAVTG